MAQRYRLARHLRQQVAGFLTVGEDAATRRVGGSLLGGINLGTKGVSDMRMGLPKSLGTVLLGIWLVVYGLLQVVTLPIPSINVIMAVLAIAAGVLILLGR